MNINIPRIGISGPDRGGTSAWLFTALQVLLAGGIPVRIRPARPVSVNKLDGLILGGGADVDPDSYQRDDVVERYLNETIRNKHINIFKRVGSFFYELIYPIIFLIRKLFSKQSHQLDLDRDHLEYRLIAEATHKGLPVLGICRGAQLMNTFMGGSLHKDIQSFYVETPNKRSIFPVKEIVISQGSKLEKILGVSRLNVNALHNQSVRELGKGLSVVAVEPNGVIQGIEHHTAPFLIGVQWHPELLIHKRKQRKIFQSLVKAAKLRLKSLQKSYQ